MSDKLRPITPDVIMESVYTFRGLAEHILDEQSELEPAKRREFEDIANNLQDTFFKAAQGQYNGAVVVAAMFVVHKVVEQCKQDMGLYRGGTNPTIQ